MGTNYRELYAKKKYWEDKILEVNPDIENKPGIYVYMREENGIKFAYVGQAVKVLDRLVSHMMGYDQWINLSLKKHKLISRDNLTGWDIKVIYCDAKELNDKERYYIKHIASLGYQMRNKTIGGQDDGKFGIAPNRPTKGYRDGIEQGRRQLAKELKHIIDLHLIITTKKPNKSDQNALDKFNNLLED